MSLAPNIRVACFGDVDELSDLAILTYTAAFGHSFTQPDLTTHLDTHISRECFERILADDVVLIAELAGHFIGYTQFGAAKSLSQNGDDRELRRLYVHPKFQNLGYGSLLIEAALSHSKMQNAPNIYLDVWEHNIGAQRFYKRYGFEVVGTREFEVESGAETSLELVMVRRKPVVYAQNHGLLAGH